MAGLSLNISTNQKIHFKIEFCWTEVYIVGPLVPYVLDFGDSAAYEFQSQDGFIVTCVAFVTCAQRSPESSLVAGTGLRTRITRLLGGTILYVSVLCGSGV